MADKTGIEWTDATWTPIRARLLSDTSKVGWHCVHASPGCKFCYAESINMRLGTRLPYKPGHERDVEMFLDEKMLLAPLRWKKPRMIFVCSMTDLFGDFVTDEMIDRMFAIMALAPHHTFQVLTKRSARMLAYMRVPGRHTAIMIAVANLIGSVTIGKSARHEWLWPLPNVWLGVSAEDQPRWDERVADLIETPSAVRWVSAEPLLGAIEGGDMLARLDWIVTGGESGPGARPMHPDWVRSLRDQCEKTAVAFLFKQWGNWAPADAIGVIEDGPVTTRGGNVRDWLKRYVVFSDRADRLTTHSFTAHSTNLLYDVGKKRAGRLLDGVQHDGYPA